MQKKRLKRTHRVIAMLNRQELEFLERMGMDSLFSTGHKLSHNAVIKGLIDFAIESGISGKDLGSVEDLKEKMLEVMKKYPEVYKKVRKQR